MDTDTETIDKPVTKITDTTPKYIPIETLIEYANKGLEYTEIGKLVGCGHSNISQRFKRIGYTPERLKHFKQNRADVFAFLQASMLNSITPDDIKSMAPGSKILATCQLYDKERLERGQSTEIVDVQSISLDINELIDQCKQALQPQDIVLSSDCITIDHDDNKADIS